MYTLIAKNKYKEQFELTHNPNYAITDITGLDPAEATINVTKNAGSDGSEFNSAYVNDRQITITLCINKPTEINRIALYQFFKPKFPVTLYYTNNNRDVYISGYVQNVDIGFFEKKETVQIVVTCPRPFFTGSNESEQILSNVESLFEFPFSVEIEATGALADQAIVGVTPLGNEFTDGGIEFSRILDHDEAVIYNRGDVETGAVIVIDAIGTVVTPKIYDFDTNEYFIVNTTLQRGDRLTINTRRGEKNVTLLRSGVETNLVGYIQPGSTWFQFAPGRNIFSGGADAMAENMMVTFMISNQFEGV